MQNIHTSLVTHNCFIDIIGDLSSVTHVPDCKINALIQEPIDLTLIDFTFYSVYEIFHRIHHKTPL